MFANNFKKLDYEKIIDAFETGTPPENKYLPDVYVGRDQMFSEINSTIDGVLKNNANSEIIFLNGERGQGKTVTANTILERFKRDKGINNIIRVYIDLGTFSNPVDLFRQLFFAIITQTFNLPEVDQKEQNMLYSLLEQFTVELRFHVLRPESSSPPINLITDLANIVADLDGVLCLIIDELDVLSISHLIPVLNYGMEIFRILNDVARAKKIWIFCSTSSGQSIFQESASQGNAFASRIFQYQHRTSQYNLKVLNENEKARLIENVVNFYLGSIDQTHGHIDETIHKSFNKIGQYGDLPREIIGNTISAIKIFKNFEILWKKSFSMGIGRSGALGTGNKIDSTFKKKVFAYLDQIYPTLGFTKDPPQYPSLINANENRKTDGLLTFADKYQVFIEIKYTETKATLEKSYIDQIASALKSTKSSEGVYLLIGDFKDDPFKSEDKEYVKNLGVLDRIKIFSISEKNDVNQIVRLMSVVETTNDQKELKAVCNWVILLLGLTKHIDKLLQEHKGVDNSLMRFVKKQSVDEDGKEKPPKTISRDQMKVHLQPGKIKGLAEGNIKKLKDNLNINTVNELVSLNPDTIARIPGISAKKAKDWIEEGKKVLENSLSI